MTSIDFDGMLKAARLKVRASIASPSSSSTLRASSSVLFPSRSGTPIDLAPYKIDRQPRDIYYIPNYITESEENDLKQQIYADKEPWHQLPQRRLKNIGGVPTSSSSGMIPREIPPYASSFFKLLSKDGLFEQNPNHILLNEYSHGKGIAMHKDGSLYHPCVAVLSLCGPALIQFHADPKEPSILSLLLLPRSLLLFSASAYTDYWHIIPTQDTDVLDETCANLHLLNGEYIIGQSVPRSDDVRLSLTVRSVVNTSASPASSSSSSSSSVGISNDYLFSESDGLAESDREEKRRQEAFFLRSISEQ